MSKELKINFDIKELRTKVLPLLYKFRRFGLLTFIVVVALVYGFLVFQVNSLNQQEPSDDAVTEKLLTVKRPKIDPNDVSKIQQLEDNSAEVQALFKQARENPFQE